MVDRNRLSCGCTPKDARAFKGGFCYRPHDHPEMGVPIGHGRMSARLCLTPIKCEFNLVDVDYAAENLRQKKASPLQLDVANLNLKQNSLKLMNHM